MFGNAGADTLSGEGGKDALRGRGGDDILLDGAGKDSFFGGAGADTFVFAAASQSFGSETSAIQDFTAGSDVIDVSQMDALAGDAGDQAFTFLGSDAFSGTAGELRFQIGSHGTTLVEADLDGNESADFSVVLRGNVQLTADDFVL